MAQLTLQAGDYRLVLTPDFGGAVARFEWCDLPLFRPVCGPSIFDTGCFPLVPFSNRIAFGRFSAGRSTVQLQPNFPGSDHPHALHGFGWLRPWTAVAAAASHARIEHVYREGEWPWPYAAAQEFLLTDAGLSHRISVKNLGGTAMPAGLGVHPYFIRNERTIYHGLHHGEWNTAPDGLPVTLQKLSEAVDWWHGAPVGQRMVDTVYTERSGPLSVIWPESGLALHIAPSALLAFTTVYTPAERNFFCVEPVSHSTDAINRPATDSGLRWLQAGESLHAEVTYQARSLT